MKAVNLGTTHTAKRLAFRADADRPLPATAAPIRPPQEDLRRAMLTLVTSHQLLNFGDAAAIVWRVQRWKNKSKVEQAEEVGGKPEFPSPAEVAELRDAVVKAHPEINFAGATLKTFSCSSLGEESGAGYFSVTERTSPDWPLPAPSGEPTPPKTLIQKSVGAYDEAFLSMALGVGAYVKEHLFYKHLQPMLGGEGMGCKCYFSTDERILMEDLGPIAEVGPRRGHAPNHADAHPRMPAIPRLSAS